jgi:hypothetical protein
VEGRMGREAGTGSSQRSDSGHSPGPFGSVVHKRSLR